MTERILLLSKDIYNWFDSGSSLSLFREIYDRFNLVWLPRITTGLKAFRLLTAPDFFILGPSISTLSNGRKIETQWANRLITMDMITYDLYIDGIHPVNSQFAPRISGRYMAIISPNHTIDVYESGDMSSFKSYPLPERDIRYIRKDIIDTDMGPMFNIETRYYFPNSTSTHIKENRLRSEFQGSDLPFLMYDGDYDVFILEERMIQKLKNGILLGHDRSDIKPKAMDFYLIDLRTMRRKLLSSLSSEGRIATDHDTGITVHYSFMNHELYGVDIWTDQTLWSYYQEQSVGEIRIFRHGIVVISSSSFIAEPSTGLSFVIDPFTGEKVYTGERERLRTFEGGDMARHIYVMISNPNRPGFIFIR